uniref:C-type lectin domain-containing protein n=1 Tax=Oreochromis niloticus TaxID=8128 RepID=A0A669BA10_ORENI
MLHPDCMFRDVDRSYFLTGWLIFSRCRQYHFVNESLDWGAAVWYCRKNYVGLANFENATEMKQFNKTVSSAGYNSEVWIGAYLSFYWSDVSQINDDYWKWENQTKNEPFSVYYLCTKALVNASYWSWDHYINCSLEYPFICYNGTYQSPEFVFVNKSMDWFRALRYCRENFTDLAGSSLSVSNAQRLVSYGNEIWIGYIIHPQIFWIDGRDSSFRYWDESGKIFGISNPLCGVADMQRSGKWRLLPYNTPRPFVCYDNLPAPQPETTEAPKNEIVYRKVIKIRLKLKDSSVDLNDTAAKATHLKELQDRLKEKGVNGVTVQWREQPDGAVFHKDRESTQRRKLSCEF